jgi:hypothetical protein
MNFLFFYCARKTIKAIQPLAPLKISDAAMRSLEIKLMMLWFAILALVISVFVAVNYG